MGAIVTKASGKLNGHCFRYSRNTQILQVSALPSKSWNKSKNSFINSTQIGFSTWSKLSLIIRNAWSEESLKYEYIDRWGNPKVLSGREFFSKCYLNCLKSEQVMPVIDYFSGVIPVCNFDDIIINTEAGTFEYREFNFEASSKLVVCIQKISGNQVNLTSKQIKIVAVTDTDDYDSSNLYTLIKDNGFKFITGSWYSVNTYCVTRSGVVSPAFILNVQAVDD